MHNSGHLATEIDRIELSVDYTSHIIVGQGLGGGGGPWEPATIAHLTDVNMTLPPLNSVTVPLPINCDELSHVVRRLDAATDLVDLISGKNVTIGDPNRFLQSVRGTVYLNVDFGTAPDHGNRSPARQSDKFTGHRARTYTPPLVDRVLQKRPGKV